MEEQFQKINTSRLDITVYVLLITCSFTTGKDIKKNLLHSFSGWRLPVGPRWHRCERDDEVKQAIRNLTDFGNCAQSKVLFLWLNSPNPALASSFLRFLYHTHWTHRPGRTPWTSDQLVTEVATYTTQKKNILALSGIWPPDPNKSNGSRSTPHCFFVYTVLSREKLRWNIEKTLRIIEGKGLMLISSAVT